MLAGPVLCLGVCGHNGPVSLHTLFVDLVHLNSVVFLEGFVRESKHEILFMLCQALVLELKIL